jgi:hypothetical protein
MIVGEFEIDAMQIGVTERQLSESEGLKYPLILSCFVHLALSWAM